MAPEELRVVIGLLIFFFLFKAGTALFRKPGAKPLMSNRGQAVLVFVVLVVLLTMMRLERYRT